MKASGIDGYGVDEDGDDDGVRVSDYNNKKQPNIFLWPCENVM